MRPLGLHPQTVSALLNCTVCLHILFCLTQGSDVSASLSPFHEVACEGDPVETEPYEQKKEKKILCSLSEVERVVKNCYPKRIAFSVDPSIIYTDSVLFRGSLGVGVFIHCHWVRGKIHPAAHMMPVYHRVIKERQITRHAYTYREFSSLNMESYDCGKHLWEVL